MTSVSEWVRKFTAPRDQLLAQLDVVEDLAVEGDPDALVVVRHRLRAGRKIDDGKPRMGEAEAVAVARPLAVRAAVAQLREHPAEAVSPEGCARREPRNSQQFRT